MVSNRFSRLFYYGLSDGSLGQRLGTLLNWPKYFSANMLKGFFGTGYGSVTVDYLVHYSMFKFYSTVDSEVTVYLVETRIVGMLLLIISLIKSFITEESSKFNVLSNLSLIICVVELLTLDTVSNNTNFSLLLITFLIGYKYKTLLPKDRI